jgi:hypothetical protein
MEAKYSAKSDMSGILTIAVQGEQYNPRPRGRLAPFVAFQ